MNYTILVPFWGNHPAYRRWLDEWLQHYRRSGCKAPVIIVSDEELPTDIGTNWLKVDTKPFQRHVDPAFPYDRKGAIVCAAAIELWHWNLLVLDADAFLMADPTKYLELFSNYCAIAMPEDEGAFGRPYAAPHEDIVRRCAGVIWFGAATQDTRLTLVADYCARFEALGHAMKAGAFQEERRLLEQHAWTFVAHGFNAPLLPRELNWPASIPSAGRNPRAVIHHHIGRRKWANVAEAPTPGLLNEGQLAAIAKAKGGRR